MRFGIGLTPFCMDPQEVRSKRRHSERRRSERSLSLRQEYQKNDFKKASSPPSYVASARNSFPC